MLQHGCSWFIHVHVHVCATTVWYGWLCTCTCIRRLGAGAALATTEPPEDFSVFDALRDTIYSEVATLIANNENRPHFLVRCTQHTVHLHVHVQCTCTRSIDSNYKALDHNREAILHNQIVRLSQAYLDTWDGAFWGNTGVCMLVYDVEHELVTVIIIWLFVHKYMYM